MAAATLALGIIGGTPGTAQQVQLRYAPGLGSAYRMHVWTEATTLVHRGGDTTRALDYEALESTTRRVVSVAASDVDVEVVRDSVEARYRTWGADWQAIDDRGTTPRATVKVDERMRVLSVSEGPQRSGQLFRGMAGGFEIALPPTLVGPGDSWEEDLAFRVPDDVLPAEARPDVGGRLWGRFEARSTITLDSLLARGGDTLAFMTFRATARPVARTVPAEVANATVTLGGASSGTVVWSTAWNAYVSGASRTKVHVTKRVGVFGEEPMLVFRLDTDVVSRFRVRP